jgi:hypothetical protein
VKLEISLARFKKKKKHISEPDPKDTENTDTPPTESTENPPTESDSDEKITGKWTDGSDQKDHGESKPTIVDDSVDKSATKRLTDRLFWMRIAFSISGGVIATFAFEDIVDVEEKRWSSIGFMIMLFIATTIIAKSWRIRIANRKKYVTTGIGSFVFLYLFFWIMSHTLVNAGTSTSIIPFP